jgi:hypothetical protein
MTVYVSIDGPDVRAYTDLDDAIADAPLNARIVSAKVRTERDSDSAIRPI